MGNSAGKPGVMFYFDYIPALKMLTDEQRGKLLLGLICYAKDGTDPEEELDLQTKTMWVIMRPIIDRDDENYNKKVENARKSVQKREARRKRINDILAETNSLTPGVRRALQDMAIPEEEEVENEENLKKAYESVTEHNQLQQQLQSQPQSQFELQRQRQIQRLQQY